MTRKSGLVAALLAAGSMLFPSQAQTQEINAGLSFKNEVWAEQTRNFRHRNDFKAEAGFSYSIANLSGYFGYKNWYRNDDSLGTIYTPKLKGSELSAEADYFLEKYFGAAFLLKSTITESFNCEGGLVFHRRASFEAGRDRRFGTTAQQDLERIDHGELPPTIAYENGIRQQMQCSLHGQHGGVFLQYMGPHLTSVENLTLPWSDYYLKMIAAYGSLGLEVTASL